MAGSTCIRDVTAGIPDFIVFGSHHMPGEPATANNIAVVLFEAIKPWIIDHVRYSLDKNAIDQADGGTASFYTAKAPEGVSLDALVALPAANVMSAAVNLGTVATGAQTAVPFVAAFADEESRKFNAGDRLVAILTNLYQEADLAALQSSSSAFTPSSSAFGPEHGLEGLVVSWLGRTDQS